LDVRKGGIEAFADETGTFDVLTISHVIEHVPNPLQLLESAYRLLKNGGVLWLETPNIDAFGHERFGPHWRGLEVPRHLVVFSRRGLLNLMRTVGFDELEEHPRMWNYSGLAAASRAIAAGQDPAGVRLTVWDRVAGLVMRIRLAFNPMRTEFLTVIARKPRTR
jgi:SAM-dependent methyltransferase